MLICYLGKVILSALFTPDFFFISETGKKSLFVFSRPDLTCDSRALSLSLPLSPSHKVKLNYRRIINNINYHNHATTK